MADELYEAEVAAAIESWVAEVLGMKKDGGRLAVTYPHITNEKGDLPDAQVDVRDKSIALGSDVANRFPWAQLQQRMLRVFEINVSFLVEHQDGLVPDKESTDELREYGKLLEQALLRQGTLGDRVQMASPICQFDYSLPFVQYADGTRGRQMIFNLAVAELADYEE